MSQIDKEALRITHISESDGLTTKQRHGFFSIPISTAIGDDGPYKTRIHPKNQQGKPETVARNFQTSPTRSGQLKNSFLGPLNSLATSDKKDQFIEEPKRLIKQEFEHRKGKKHQRQLFPASNHKLEIKPSYLYKEEMNPEKDPRRNREEDGKVKSVSRQLQTNIQSKVITDYFKPLKHVSDPISRAHDFEWERQKNEKAKEGQAPFSPNKFTSDLLNSNRQIFNDHQIKRNRYFQQTRFNILNHERRWRDTNANRKGLYGFIAPFPPYLENPPTQVSRQNKSSDKEIFKAMNRTTQIIPSPSITQHPINLRRSLNHSFSHRP